MTIDPDILAIRRRRRQEGRCVGCGTKVSRSALCNACGATQAYCPGCDALYPRRPGLRRGFNSAYCPACLERTTRRQRGSRPWAVYLADVQAHRHRLLPAIIHRYERGQLVADIAEALGLTHQRVDRLIQDARLRGEWPEDLRRYKKKPKKGRGNAKKRS